MQAADKGREDVSAHRRVFIVNRFHFSVKQAAPLPGLIRALGLIVILAVFAAIIIHCIAEEWVWLRSPVLTGTALTLKRRDVPDWDLLIGGVRQAHGFRDTLSWWHTTWVWPYGYWRPLSALAFWLEYRAFGEHFNDWFATLIVSHVLFCACLSWFAYSLTTRWTVAILSATIFAAPRPVQLTALEWLPGYGSQVPGDVILDYWKNNVEAWLGIVVLLALVAAVQRRYSLAFALAGLSVCFKETGWLTFPLIVMVAAGFAAFRRARGLSPPPWPRRWPRLKYGSAGTCCGRDRTSPATEHGRIDICRRSTASDLAASRI